MNPLRMILGRPSVAANIQPVRSISTKVGLYNSIHSSDDEASVPAQAISLITTLKGLKGTGSLKRKTAKPGWASVDVCVAVDGIMTVCVDVAETETVDDGVCEDVLAWVAGAVDVTDCGCVGVFDCVRDGVGEEVAVEVKSGLIFE